MNIQQTSSTDWLPAAVRYIESWLEFQMRVSEQPGCSIAIACEGTPSLERAFGAANLTTGEVLTPQNRFRVASQSKTFTAAALMLLRERGRVRLDDAVGQYVKGLPDALAEATLMQLLSHSAGLTSNGTEQAYWNGLLPWPDERTLRGELSLPLILSPGERHKYSNLGYGLLGLAIEAVTGERFDTWITREVLQTAGLHDTVPDYRASEVGAFASGHAGRLPMGRFVIEGTDRTDALSAATGFVSTPGDLARFFGQLDPASSDSILSVASRREMARRHWRSEPAATETYYGLGLASGSIEGHEYFGHSGSFQGYQSRTCVVPEWRVAASIIVNAIDGPASSWMDTVVHILNRFAGAGRASEAVSGWEGRWWNVWGAVDLVPLGDVVVLASPDDASPFTDADEIEPLSPTQGRIRRSSGYRNYGEAVERTISKDGQAETLRVAGDEFLPEVVFVSRQASLNR